MDSNSVRKALKAHVVGNLHQLKGKLYTFFGIF